MQKAPISSVMTQEQSTKTVEMFKNFISPFDCDVIYFDFTSETEFTVKFFNESDWDGENLCRKNINPDCLLLEFSGLKKFNSSIYGM